MRGRRAKRIQTTRRSPSQVLRGLRGELIQHLRTEADGLDPGPMVAAMVELVRLAEEEAGLTELGGWQRTHVDQVLGTLADRPDPVATQGALGLLVGFLADTGRWTGDDDALDLLTGSLNTVMADSLRTRAEQLRSPDAEAAALASTDTVITLTAFMAWLGHRPRQLTATGALRRADTTDVLATLQLDQHDRAVTSMWDHPGLTDIWEAAVRSGMIAVHGGRVVRTSVGAALVDGDPGACRSVVVLQMAEACTRPLPLLAPDGVPPGAIVDIVLSALDGDGPPVPHFGPEDSFLDSSLWDVAATIGSVAAAGLDPHSPAGLAAVTALTLASNLLRTDVFCTVDGTLGIVPGLEGFALTVLADLVEGAPIADGGTLLGAARARGAVSSSIDDIIA